MIIADDYSINLSTMLLKSTFSEYGEHHTIVYELNQEVYVKKSPMTILEENILQLGTTYEGIIQATKYLLPGQKMLCVLFSALDRICFFNTTSILRHDNLLLAYSHIAKIAPSGKGSLLTFTNGKQLYVLVFHRILVNRRSHASYVADTFANNYRAIQNDQINPIFMENNDGNDYGDFIQ
ncbi:competence protein ComK [Bacillus gobiensis]|uniref:competence protein ComK n=1 Tax=Bacillus gobiensis TaxID=1441095 RepID=UPI003D234E9E